MCLYGRIRVPEEKLPLKAYKFFARESDSGKLTNFLTHVYIRETDSRLSFKVEVPVVYYEEEIIHVAQPLNRYISYWGFHAYLVKPDITRWTDYRYPRAADIELWEVELSGECYIGYASSLDPTLELAAAHNMRLIKKLN